MNNIKKRLLGNEMYRDFYLLEQEDGTWLATNTLEEGGIEWHRATLEDAKRTVDEALSTGKWEMNKSKLRKGTDINAKYDVLYGRPKMTHDEMKSNGWTDYDIEEYDEAYEDNAVNIPSGAYDHYPIWWDKDYNRIVEGSTIGAMRESLGKSDMYKNKGGKKMKKTVKEIIALHKNKNAYVFYSDANGNIKKDAKVLSLNNPKTLNLTVGSVAVRKFGGKDAVIIGAVQQRGRPIHSDGISKKKMKKQGVKTPVVDNKVVDAYIRKRYGNTVLIGGMRVDTAEAMKKIDPISYNLAVEEAKERMKKEAGKTYADRQIEGLAKTIGIAPSSDDVRVSNIAGNSRGFDVRMGTGKINMFSKEHQRVMPSDGGTTSIVPVNLKETNVRLNKKAEPRKMGKLKVISERPLEQFDFWSGAKDNANMFVRFGGFALLNRIGDALEEMYPEGLDDSTLNDLFWFEPEFLAESVGLYLDPDDGELYSEKPSEDEDEEYDDE